MSSYWPAIFFSVVLHSLLVCFVVWGWGTTQQDKVVKPPVYIKASLVEIEQKATPKKKIPKANDQKQQALKKKKLQQKKRAEQKRQERIKQQQLAQKKLKQQQEKQRKEQLLKELKQERQNELVKAAAQEQALLAAQAQAAEDAIVVQSYYSIIHDKVSENWNRPPSSRNSMEVTLRIQLIPIGDVVGVDITSSSGDRAFDRSAIRAVKKAQRFPELKKLPNRIFEKKFRTCYLTFSPEDLRQ